MVSHPISTHRREAQAKYGRSQGFVPFLFLAPFIRYQPRELNIVFSFLSIHNSTYWYLPKLFEGLYGTLPFTFWVTLSMYQCVVYLANLSLWTKAGPVYFALPFGHLCHSSWCPKKSTNWAPSSVHLLAQRSSITTCHNKIFWPFWAFYFDLWATLRLHQLFLWRFPWMKHIS